MFAYVTMTFLFHVTNDVCEPFDGLSMTNIQSNECMVCLGWRGCVQNTNRGRTWKCAFGEGAPSQKKPCGPINHCFFTNSKLLECSLDRPFTKNLASKTSREKMWPVAGSGLL